MHEINGDWGGDEALSDDISHLANPQFTRDHHYVPRFLLAGFTPSGRKSDKLWSFDRERTKPEHRTPAAIAFEPDYYTVDIPGQPPDLVENFFSKVESLAAPVIRSMVANQAVPIGEDFGNLMYFLGLMFGRLTPIREALKESLEGSLHLAGKIAATSIENYEATVRGMPPSSNRPTFEMMKKWASEENFVELANISGIHAQATMFALDGMAPGLLGMRTWSLLIAEEDGEQFVCSDVPISLIASEAAAIPHIPPGLIYQETDFIMPIHRTAALLGRFEGKSSVYEVDDEVVGCVNSRTMSAARRYIYASNPEFHILDGNRMMISGSNTWLQEKTQTTN